MNVFDLISTIIKVLYNKLNSTSILIASFMIIYYDLLKDKCIFCFFIK